MSAVGPKSPVCTDCLMMANEVLGIGAWTETLPVETFNNSDNVYVAGTAALPQADLQSEKLG